MCCGLPDLGRERARRTSEEVYPRTCGNDADQLVHWSVSTQPKKLCLRPRSTSHTFARPLQRSWATYYRGSTQEGRLLGTSATALDSKVAGFILLEEKSQPITLLGLIIPSLLLQPRASMAKQGHKAPHHEDQAQNSCALQGGGSTKNGRGSNSQRRGVKVYGGQPVKAGGIIVRQVGSTVRAHSRFPRHNLRLELLQKQAVCLTMAPTEAWARLAATC